MDLSEKQEIPEHTIWPVNRGLVILRLEVISDNFSLGNDGFRSDNHSELQQIVRGHGSGLKPSNSFLIP